MSDKLVKVIYGICIIIAIVMIGIVVFHVIDRELGSKYTKTGIITKLVYIPESKTLIGVGPSAYPETVPAKLIAIVKYKNKDYRVEITPKQFVKYKTNQKITIIFSKGYYTDNKYFYSIK